MATEFTMPKLGLTMEEATIIEWLVADGADVPEGAAVMRIETDKTETEVEIGVAGVLHRVGKEGDVYPCGAVIAYVLAPGEAAPTAAAAAPAAVSAPSATAPAIRPSEVGSTPVRPTPTGRIVASPNARRLAAERGIDLRTVAGTGPGARIVSEDLDGHRAGVRTSIQRRCQRCRSEPRRPARRRPQCRARRSHRGADHP